MEVNKMVEPTEKDCGQSGYELMQSIGVKADFFMGLASVLNCLSEPLKANKNLRVVIDYNPQTDKMDFRYYRPSDG